MILVAYRGSGNIEYGKILFKIDAWAQGAYEQAREYIKTNHWLPTEQKITLNGDMIIWVE